MNWQDRLDISRIAKRAAPVDKGTLRQSIRSEKTRQNC